VVKRLKRIELSDEKSGALNLQELQRMISVPSSALGSLRQELINTLGLVRAKGFLLRYGWNCGVSDGLKVKELEWENQIDRLLAGPKMHTLNGHVDVEPWICEADFEKGSLHFEGIWRNSYEANEHLKLFGHSDETVCHSLVGYASGYLSTIMEKAVIVKETQCEAMGDDHCHWVCKTIDKWDNEIDIESEISFYETDRIVEELDETYEKLRIERDNLSKTYDVHRKLVKEVLREKGMKSIADALYQAMKMPVFIEDRSLSLIAVGALSADQAQPYSEEFQSWVEHQQKKKALKWKEIKQTLLLDISQNHRRVITPIYMGQNIHGYCSFLYNEDVIKEVDKMVLEQAALACSLFLLNERTRLNTEQRMKGSFIKDILNKRLSMPEIVKRARYIDFQLDGPYFMIALCRLLNTPSLNEELEIYDQFLNKLQTYFKNNYINALVDQRSENVIILLSENTILKNYLNKEEFCNRLLDYCSSLTPEFVIKMGVSSNTPSIEHISNLYEECLASVKVANRRQNLIYFDSLGLVGILLQANNLDAIEKFAYKILGNLIEEDKNKNMELTKTLYFYLENGSNVHKTARAMNLSISGLRYRLGRINEILEMEINTPYIRHEIYVALQSLIVLGELEIE
jgi:PucR family transcriptional regulator, purine catabolism regulatory protein